MKTKTKKILNIVAAALCATATAMCSACNTYHEHEYSSDWSYDANRHWHAATCEHTYETKDRAAHVFDEEGKTCVICGYQKPHEHEYAAEWSWDDDYHYHAPVCGDTEEVADKAEHTYDENGDCTECGAHHDHSFAQDWKSDNTGHWHAATCKHSDIKGEFSPHVNEDENDLCDVCGYMLPHTHRFSEEWDWDGDQHFHRDTCGHGQITDVAPHEYVNGVCACGKSRNELSITSSGKYAAYEIHFNDWGATTTLPLKDVPAGVYKLFCDRTDIKHTQDLKAVLPSALIATPKYESGSSSAVYSCKVYEDTDTYNPTYTGTLTIGEGATAITITNSIGSMTCDVYLEKYTAPALEASETGTAYTKVTYPASQYGSANQYKIPLGKSVVPGWYFLSVQYNYPKDSASLTAYVTVGDKVYRRSMGERDDGYPKSFEVGIEIPEGETEISINHSFEAFNVEQVEIYLETTKTLELGKAYEREVIKEDTSTLSIIHYNFKAPEQGEYNLILDSLATDNQWAFGQIDIYSASGELIMPRQYEVEERVGTFEFEKGDVLVFGIQPTRPANYTFTFKIDKK